MEMTGDSPTGDRRPWGLLASLAWYVVVFEIAGRLYDLALNSSGLQAALDRHYVTHTLGILAAWAVTLLVTMLAARLTRVPLCDYLGWRRPRLRDVLLAFAIIAALYAAFGALVFFSGNAAGAVGEYRAAIAAGTSSWWFVLKWWPTLILSPFVEETFFRGFLWRGVEFYHGKWMAFVVSTVLFAAMHYSYWMPDGAVEWGSVVQYLVSSAIFGALRWRSGSAVVPMLAHSLDNAGLKIVPIVLSALVP